MIATAYFSVRPGRYVRQVAMIWALRWGWAIALPLSACVICGLWRPIWFVVALGLMLVVYPGVLALLYFNYALRPEAAMAVIPHRVVIDADGITVEYAPPDECSTDVPLDDDSDPWSSVAYHTPAPRHIPMTAVAMVEDAGSALLVHLRSSVYDIIELPSASFADGELDKALKILSPPSPSA